MNKFLKIITLFLIFFIIFIFSLELFARFKKPSWHVSDPKIGWKLKKNFSHTYKNYDQDNNMYYSKFQTNQNGLRVYGNKNSKIKILTLGDSFTAEPYAGNDKMWFSYLSNKISDHTNQEVVVYAAGGGGYSSLQEYLLLKEIINKQDYNIFILQFCSNDFGSNLFEAETSGNNFNQFFKRPYMNKSGNIIFYQSFFAKLFRTKLIGESRFFNKLLFLFSIYKNNETTDKNEKNILDEKSITITNLLLKKIRSIVHLDKAYIINCDNTLEGPNKNWKKIAKKNNFIPLELPNKKIEIAIKNKNKIFFSDLAHFNNFGNKIFGEAIFEEMTNYEKFNF